MNPATVTTGENIRVLNPAAKINLGLQVLHKRPDGYHHINTVFARVNLCDQLTLRINNQGRIACAVQGNPDLKGNEMNLCVRAARALQGLAADHRLGLDMELVKYIPAGAGLGGGSADAAATLLAARDMWKLSVPDAPLLALAAELGSDVPFFVMDTPMAIGTGRGEELRPVPLSLPWYVLLVNPGVHVPTPQAYALLERDSSVREQTDFAGVLRRAVETGDVGGLKDGLYNDFESVVLPRYPQIARVKESLPDHGAFFAMMSGSGSTVFGLYHTHATAQAGAAGVQALYPDYLCAVARVG